MKQHGWIHESQREGEKSAQICATSGPWRRLVGALRHFKTRSSSSLGPWRLEVLAGGGHVRSHVIHRSVELHVRLGMWILGVKASLKTLCCQTDRGDKLILANPTFTTTSHIINW